MVGGKKQSAHKSDPQAQTRIKSNRGPYLIIFGTVMILLRVGSIALTGHLGFLDLLLGGTGVFSLIDGITTMAKKS
jgi:hypothetical protein